METLLIRAANMLYQDQTGMRLDDPYRAVDCVAAFDKDWYPRTVRFRWIQTPVDANPNYQYLVAWVDATPPRQLHIDDLLPHTIETPLLERLRAGDVIGFRPQWVEDVWVLREC